ncbi:MAG: response regulator [Steroidobacteraceae bacterium]
MALPGRIIYVIDDDAAMREGLSSLLRSIGHTVILFASAAAFLAYARPATSSCLVLDVRLPDRSGLDLQRDLRVAGEDLPIIFITGHGDIPMTVRAMKAGAIEFLSKPFREQDLLDAIASALTRDADVRSRRAQQAIVHERLTTLTPREGQVMECLLRGMLNKQIAASLGVTEVTVKLHRRHVMEKMLVSSLVELAQLMARIR